MLNIASMIIRLPILILDVVGDNTLQSVYATQNSICQESFVKKGLSLTQFVITL